MKAKPKRRPRASRVRTADEILWEQRQEKVTRDLVDALTAYVKFHEANEKTNGPTTCTTLGQPTD